jgi:hypothetical protein
VAAGVSEYLLRVPVQACLLLSGLRRCYEFQELTQKNIFGKNGQKIHGDTCSWREAFLKEVAVL